MFKRILALCHIGLTLQERIKELTDKFNAELDADRQKFEALLQDKNEQEMEYEEKLKQVSSHSSCWSRTSNTTAMLRSPYVHWCMGTVSTLHALEPEKPSVALLSCCCQGKPCPMLQLLYAPHAPVCRLSSGTTTSSAPWTLTTKASSWQRWSATNSCCRKRRHSMRGKLAVSALVGCMTGYVQLCSDAQSEFTSTHSAVLSCT